MTLAELKTRRYTRDEYYRLAQEGRFAGQRVQLIEGEIVEMPPQGRPHALAYLMMQRALFGIFGPDRVQSQLPLNVPGDSDPEPDLAVLERPVETYKEDHPTTALLVVEIADSSLYLDRRKAGLYARAGVPDYWVVDVDKRVVKVFRAPVADAAQQSGYGYAEHFEVSQNDVISPLAAPNSKIEIKKIFVV
jgi:Uma2 family endonuclease